MYDRDYLWMTTYLTSPTVTRNLTEATCQTPIRNHRGELTTLTIAITPITVLVATLRLSYKHFFIGRAHLSTEEWTLIAAAVIGIAGVPLEILGITNHGIGTDVWGLDRSTLVAFQRFFYVEQIIYVTLMLLLKLTMAFFYLNIFFGRGLRALLWGLIIFHVASTTAFSIGIVFQCLPINYQWDKFNHMHDDTFSGHCINTNAAGWVNSAFSVASDLWLLAIPLSQLHKMNLHWKKKLGASLMFVAGTR